MQKMMIDIDGIPAYLCNPAGDTPLPAVVVIQEWWGLDEHIKSVTERLAHEGFVALAPDLYHGVVTDEPDEARKLVMEMFERGQAVSDIQAAINYLVAQPFVQPKQVGTVGFCMGGGLSQWMAAEGEHVGATVVFYGDRLDDDSIPHVNSPILGLYGEEDAGLPVSKVRDTEAKLKQWGKVIEVVVYPEAQHAFFNETRAAYHPTAAADAWQRAVAWFRRYLV